MKTDFLQLCLIYDASRPWKKHYHKVLTRGMNGLVSWRTTCRLRRILVSRWRHSFTCDRNKLERWHLRVRLHVFRQVVTPHEALVTVLTDEVLLTCSRWYTQMSLKFWIHHVFTRVTTTDRCACAGVASTRPTAWISCRNQQNNTRTDAHRCATWNTSHKCRIIPTIYWKMPTQTSSSPENVKILY